MSVKLIKPDAHPLIVDLGDPHVYVDCTRDTCHICRKFDLAKNMKLVDDLVKGLFRK